MWCILECFNLPQTVQKFLVFNPRLLTGKGSRVLLGYLILFGSKIITKSKRVFCDLQRSLSSNGTLQNLELLPASQGCQYNQTPPSVSQSKVMLLQALSKSLRQNNWYHHRRKLNTLCPCIFFHHRWWLWPFQENQYQSENTMHKYNYVDFVGYETKFCLKDFLFKVYCLSSSDKKMEI